MCGYFLWTCKIMSTYAYLNETRVKEQISATHLFHGINNLGQHSYINVNNVSDVIAIKQFLGSATDFKHKSLLNEVLSALFKFFFSQVAVIICIFGYEMTKKVETFELW